jgi:hypothetical protein
MPIWLRDTEEDATGRTGRMPITMGDFSTSFSGTATPEVDINGSLNRALDSFQVSFKQTSWPQFWPQVCTQYNISRRNNVLETYETWTAYKDLTIQQGKLYDSTTVADINEIKREIQVLQTYGTHQRFISYAIPMYARLESASDITQQYKLIVNSSATAQWGLYAPTGELLYGERDMDGAFMTNISDVGPTFGGKNFNEAYVDNVYSGLKLGNDLTDGQMGGLFLDSTEWSDNNNPQPHLGSSTGPDFNGTADYDKNGVADDSSADYRRGIVEMTNLINEPSLIQFTSGISPACLSQGARNDTYPDGTGDLASHEWYQKFDGQVAENVHSTFGSSSGYGWSGGDFTFEFNNISARLDDVLRKMAICHAFSKPVGTNRLGRPYGICDVRVGGSLNMAIGDFTQTERDWASFWYALCMCDERFAYGGLVFKGQPAPTPDEWFYDIGDPVATRSMGTLSNDGSWTTATADDTSNGAWYFREFDNGYFYVNIPTISDAKDSTYSGMATGYATTAYPTAPGGKVAKRLNASTYTSTLSGFSPLGYNTSKNDGSSPYILDELIEPAWRGGLVIWEDA